MDFRELNLAEMDRELSNTERDEWQMIYASCHGQNIMNGTVVGTEWHEISYVPKGKRKSVKQNVCCLIVIPYRVKIIIPSTETFLIDVYDCDRILSSMCGAPIEFIITDIDRENGIALGSRKRALAERQRDFSRHIFKEMQDRLINTTVILVSRAISIVSFRGYDVFQRSRDVSYTHIPDLRTEMHTGDKRQAKVLSFEPEKGLMSLSLRDAMPHPFDGIESRHPIGAIRTGTITGRYVGGVYVKVDDNYTEVKCDYGTMHSPVDFQMGDQIQFRIRKYDYRAKLVYGRITLKLRSVSV